MGSGSAMGAKDERALLHRGLLLHKPEENATGRPPSIGAIERQQSARALDLPRLHEQLPCPPLLRLFDGRTSLS